MEPPHQIGIGKCDFRFFAVQERYQGGKQVNEPSYHFQKGCVRACQGLDCLNIFVYSPCGSFEGWNKRYSKSFTDEESTMNLPNKDRGIYSMQGLDNKFISWKKETSKLSNYFPAKSVLPSPVVRAWGFFLLVLFFFCLQLLIWALFLVLSG